MVLHYYLQDSVMTWSEDTDAMWHFPVYDKNIVLDYKIYKDRLILK